MVRLTTNEACGDVPFRLVLQVGRLPDAKTCARARLSTAHLDPRGLPKREGESALGLARRAAAVGEGGGASLFRGRAASRADYHTGELKYR